MTDSIKQIDTIVHEFEDESDNSKLKKILRALLIWGRLLNE